MPQALAFVTRRFSSCIRSGVRATSMPPDSVKTPSSLYCSVESLVSSNISLEYSIGKMKLDAWPVSRPGSAAGPYPAARCLPAKQGQVVDQAVADDPRANDHGARAGLRSRGRPSQS